jgi:hypothetical protein
MNERLGNSDSIAPSDNSRLNNVTAGRSIYSDINTLLLLVVCRCFSMRFIWMFRAAPTGSNRKAVIHILANGLSPIKMLLGYAAPVTLRMATST